MHVKGGCRHWLMSTWCQEDIWNRYQIPGTFDVCTCCMKLFRTCLLQFPFPPDVNFTGSVSRLRISCSAPRGISRSHTDCIVAMSGIVQHWRIFKPVSSASARGSVGSMVCNRLLPCTVAHSQKMLWCCIIQAALPFMNISKIAVL